MKRRENYSRSKSRSGLPVSGDSFAFFTASWNFFSRREDAFFCASMDCWKIDSRRLSCSRIALAAASMSLKVFGLTAAVCAITARSSVSIFSSALQHGHVTSKFEVFFATQRIIPQNPSSGAGALARVMPKASQPSRVTTMTAQCRALTARFDAV